MSTDLFSKQADLYSQFRPQYPVELFQFIVSQCDSKELAWDCATGNGQAAHAISKYFKEIIATDISENQIKNAITAENIKYKILPAEQKLDIKDHSLDLVTVAQAIHWFDLDKFYAEIKRTLKPGGIFAIWAYGFHAPIQKEIDEILNNFYFETLGSFWKSNNKLIWNEYKDLYFPFKTISVPKFKLNVNWSLNELIGYFKTWSSTQLFIEKNKFDPTVELAKKIGKYWGKNDEHKNLHWDLVVKIAKI